MEKKTQDTHASPTPWRGSWTYACLWDWKRETMKGHLNVSVFYSAVSDAEFHCAQ